MCDQHHAVMVADKSRAPRYRDSGDVYSSMAQQRIQNFPKRDIVLVMFRRDKSLRQYFPTVTPFFVLRQNWSLLADGICITRSEYVSTLNYPRIEMMYFRRRKTFDACHTPGL